MTDVITFTTSLPPRGCSPNRSDHWSGAYTAKRDYREEVWADAAVAGASHLRWAAARISLTFGTHRRPGDGRYHPTDRDNAVASFKAGQDGIVDTGLIEDDAFAHLEIGEIVIDPTQYGVTIVLERIEE